MNSKYGTIDGAINGLEMIKDFMNDILKQLEQEENYEACIDLVSDIADLEAEINEHKRLQELQRVTGRKVSIY